MTILVVSIIIILLFVATILAGLQFKKDERFAYVNNSGMKTDPKSKSNNDRGTIFFHEDDYCQVQLIPIENLHNVEKEAQKIIESAKENFDGLGFKNIHVRADHKVQLSSRRITSDELDIVLQNLKTTRHSHVTTGHGNYSELS